MLLVTWRAKCFDDWNDTGPCAACDASGEDPGDDFIADIALTDARLSQQVAHDETLGVVDGALGVVSSQTK